MSADRRTLPSRLHVGGFTQIDEIDLGSKT